MIKIIYGNDRLAVQRAAEQVLGKDYEIIEAENVTRADMDSIFYGTSIFGETRNILLKNLNENKECWESFPDYIKTEHNIVVWLSALDKRSVVYKALTEQKSVEFKEFKIAEQFDSKLTFKVFDQAVAGHGQRALEMCKELERTSESYLVMGGVISSAMRLLERRSRKAVATLKILAQADLDMKSAGVDAWSIVKIALLKIAQL